jgi:hypothetical protein
MFKSIKEFFVGKPKVEEEVIPANTEAAIVVAPVEAVTAAPAVEEVTATPAVEEIKISAVSLNDQITEAITITAKSEPAPPGGWPFPNSVPPEGNTKPTPAIKATKKPRKKK